MNKVVLRTKLIEEIQLIPDESLMELYRFVMLFRLGLERWQEIEPRTSSEKLQQFLALEGVLADDVDFDQAIEELNEAWQTWNPTFA